MVLPDFEVNRINNYLSSFRIIQQRLFNYVSYLMNTLALLFMSTINARPFPNPAPAVLRVVPKRLYPENDQVLSAVVSSFRPSITTVLLDRSLIEGTHSHLRSGSGRSIMNSG